MKKNNRLSNPSRNKMVFHRYSALGNDYLVIDPTKFPGPNPPSPEWIQKLCHRHLGVGSDGLLWGPLFDGRKVVLRIFNPDGSEAEKSGNGIRIFARFLLDQLYIKKIQQPFSISTKGGEVQVTILDDEGKRIKVEMGHASFQSKDIGVNENHECLKNETSKTKSIQSTQSTHSSHSNEEKEIKKVRDEIFQFPLPIPNADSGHFKLHCVSMGNPHCVIICENEKLQPALAKLFGPIIEKHPLFLHKINVQFMKIINEKTIQIEIWERGAGYTMASGSSSCAAAAVAYRLGLVENKIKVRMPGGEIKIELIGDKNSPMVIMEGSVDPICQGELNENYFHL
jgi:diaminopimelate epimerase